MIVPTMKFHVLHPIEFWVKTKILKRNLIKHIWIDIPRCLNLVQTKQCIKIYGHITNCRSTEIQAHEEQK